MKRIILTGVFVLFLLSLIAQSDYQKPLSQVDLQKKEILEEAADFKKLIQNSKDEYVLDSIIYFQFLSEFDSVLSGKTEYIDVGNGEQHKFEYVWDEISETWQYFKRTTWIFDEYGNLLLYSRANWDLNSQAWLNVTKFELTYNSAGLEILFYYFTWDEIQHEWIYYIKEEYDYNSNGKMTDYWVWEWNELAGDWVGWFYQVMDYTETGNLAQRIYYDWDPDNNSWTEDDKDIYNYDDNDFLVLVSSYQYDVFLGVWNYVYKSEYTNNTSGNLEIKLDYYSYDNGVIWNLHNKTENEYNADDFLILQYFYFWNENTQDWEYTGKNEFSWDEYGNVILEKRFSWDDIQNIWHLFHMVERTYTESGNIIMWAYYYYDENLGMLVGDLKRTSVLDDNENNHISNFYNWDLTTDDWKLDRKAFYHYSIYTNVLNHNVFEVNLFPNPVTSQLHIRLKNTTSYNYSIYSCSGSEILNGRSIGQSLEISVSDLPQGKYIIRIADQNAEYSGQFIKM